MESKSITTRARIQIYWSQLVMTKLIHIDRDSNLSHWWMTDVFHESICIEIQDGSRANSDILIKVSDDQTNPIDQS